MSRPDPTRPDLRASEEETQAWYAEYYSKLGRDRNDLLTNPEVLFQSIAFDVANTRALRRIPVDRESARVLDVGCGGGTSLLTFLKLGFRAANLTGVDINSARIHQGRMDLPGIDLRCETAERMSFASGSFDIVFESTMFVQLTDERVAGSIALEMLRVTKPGGHLVLVDWRYSKPGSRDYLGMSTSRIAKLFDVGGTTQVVVSENGALVPPIGRRISQYCSPLYFPVQKLFPFMVGQRTTVLKKRSHLPGKNDRPLRIEKR